ncbi:MAG: Eco57I restriction-modification methylase domain-containing protein [Acidobacteria bacterium]|nr:Eco57I restriction-modification methylase domain-containing protein [Acidobacteriota bacterium]
MAVQLLEHTDRLRRSVAPALPAARKSALGQFMTPAPVARFMASIFPPTSLANCYLLDAGAGMGSLSCAFLDRWAAGDQLHFDKVEVEAYEIDGALRGHLEQTLANYGGQLPLTYRIHAEDFIHAAALQTLRPRRFTHAILNPPYKKINSLSAHRSILRQAGIETVNLYSAFVALALALMQTNGQLVAIIPRSFCNGPYYRPFREFILRRAALRQIHLFDSRTKAFQDDDVLQENVIIRIERGGIQGAVTISNSTDDSFSDLESHEQPFERIVFPDDPERFIHVPTAPGHNQIELSEGVRSTLSDVGIGVSTGPVVDFRLLDHIRQDLGPDAVPLLYPAHFCSLRTEWPKEGVKRGNAIQRNSETERWLYPNGFYTVVRRFSSKEEPRRIVASVVRPDNFPDVEVLGFENHLNVFHENKKGLPESLAYGLAVFLNTTAVDDHFRRFNGHTQVNATDLRLMKYPDRATLIALGKWAQTQATWTQAMMDEQTQRLTG